MHTFVPNSGKSSKVAVRTLLVAACAAGLLLAAPFDAAQARKGHRHGGSHKETEQRPPFQVGNKLHQTPGHWERSPGGGLKWVGPGTPNTKPVVRDERPKRGWTPKGDVRQRPRLPR